MSYQSTIGSTLPRRPFPVVRPHDGGHRRIRVACSSPANLPALTWTARAQYAYVVDARGLRCPLPLIRARQALAALPVSDTLIVLATDREAPIDLAALAADVGCQFTCFQDGAEWRLVLAPE